MVETDNKQPLESTDLEAKVIKQVEVYFRDINLTRNKFLQMEIKKDEGWISLDALLKFKRLAALTKDKNVIVDALKKSTTGLIEINEDKSKIRRTDNLPVPEMDYERKIELNKRTVYCNGFPRDSDLNDIIEFVSSYAGVENVVKRNYYDKLTNKQYFRGSIFVNFKTIKNADADAEAENFLKVESVKFKRVELIRKLFNEYRKGSRKEKMNKKKGKKQKSSVESEDEPDARKMKVEEELPTGTGIQFTGFAKK